MSYLGQIGRYLQSSRLNRLGRITSWQKDVRSGDAPKTDRQVYSFWFCNAEASGLQAFAARNKQELQDTLFLHDKEAAIITRWSQELWDLLNDRARLKEFSDSRGVWEVREFSDYMDSRVYAALRLRKTIVGSTPDSGVLLSEAGGYIISEDGSFNVSV